MPPPDAGVVAVAGAALGDAAVSGASPVAFDRAMAARPTPMLIVAAMRRVASEPSAPRA